MHREHSKVYAQTHKAERAVYIAAYNSNHVEERRAYATAYYLAHRQHHQALGKRYYATHLAEMKASNIKWRAEHREETRTIWHRREAKKRNQFVEDVQGAAIYDRDGGRCHVCGKHVKRTAATLDHLVPISCGGLHASWNVRLAHQSCNSKRHNTGPAQLLLHL